MITTYIIVSDSKTQPNWTGEKFSKAPAQIYPSILGVLSVLEGCYKKLHEKGDMRSVTIVSLTNEQMADKIKAKEAVL